MTKKGKSFNKNAKPDLSANEAWEILFNKYDIRNKLDQNEIFKITTDQIKEFREPRLMAKWDSSEGLPSIFKKEKVNILPISRKAYILSDFLLYEKIPELKEKVTEMDFVELPEFESLDVNNITSEANAINVLNISGILDDFLNEKENVSTFNGRMGSGEFDFSVDSFSGQKRNVKVNKAQLEIDGGFENENSVVILEAKNVVHPDFHVRQLYYPYRLWTQKVSKPIRVVFSLYSNQIYRMFEYEFLNDNDYSSIELIKEKNYSLQDTSITYDELLDVYQQTKVKYSDKIHEQIAPFVQADSFERVISLLENLYDTPLTKHEIAQLMEFTYRQSGYYFNAGKYLGLFTDNFKDEEGQKKVVLSKLGEEVYKMTYKKRQLKLVELILEHQIFNELFKETYETAKFPSRKEIEYRLINYGITKTENETSWRRAGSVLGWINWIFNLTKL